MQQQDRGLQEDNLRKIWAWIVRLGMHFVRTQTKASIQMIIKNSSKRNADKILDWKVVYALKPFYIHV